MLGGLMKNTNGSSVLVQWNSGHMETKFIPNLHISPLAVLHGTSGMCQIHLVGGICRKT